jgi:hypothetical protein
MALQISEFKAFAKVRGVDRPIVGAPTVVTILDADDDVVLQDSTIAIRIVPIGESAHNIAWSEDVQETFTAAEIRAVAGGSTIAVPAAIS